MFGAVIARGEDKRTALSAGLPAVLPNSSVL
jgi:hypothetical protein